MNKIEFYKMSGSGNDFIIIDNRRGMVAESNLSELIPRVCRRQMSVGADGFILIDNCDGADFKWHFYNSDGSRPEMCGNGARCAARFAYLHDIVGPEMTFETDAGLISAEIVGERVKIGMPDPVDLKTDYPIKVQSGSRVVSSINTGVPHVVLEEKDIDRVDVFNLGREIRNLEQFAPDGTNVNFISPRDDGRIAIRTYERGVENETLACGTGSVAAALISAYRKNLPSPISMLTRSGSVLRIHFTRRQDRFSDVYLEGDARVVYSGELWEEAWEY